MKLTPEQQAVLDGSKGEVMAKVMKKRSSCTAMPSARKKNGAHHEHLRPHGHQLRH